MKQKIPANYFVPLSEMYVCPIWLSVYRSTVQYNSIQTDGHIVSLNIHGAVISRGFYLHVGCFKAQSRLILIPRIRRLLYAYAYGGVGVARATVVDDDARKESDTTTTRHRRRWPQRLNHRSRSGQVDETTLFRREMATDLLKGLVVYWWLSSRGVALQIV